MKFGEFWDFQQIWQTLTFSRNLANFDIFKKFSKFWHFKKSGTFWHFQEIWQILTFTKNLANFDIFMKFGKFLRFTNFFDNFINFNQMFCGTTKQKIKKKNLSDFQLQCLARIGYARRENNTVTSRGISVVVFFAVIFRKFLKIFE